MALKLNMGMKWIQTTLFIINFMFAIVGTLLITLASTVLVAYREFESFIESHYFKPPEILIAVGVIIILVSLLGGIAAIKQSTMLVNVYAILLILLLLLEIAAVITVFVMQDTIRDNIEDNMTLNLMKYKTSEEARASWDYTQQRLYCCGVHHRNNWAFVKVDGPQINDQGFKYTIPFSCCGDWQCKETPDRGCLNMLSSYIANIAFMLVYITATVEVAQILGLILAWILTTTIRRVKTVEEMERQKVRQELYNKIISEQRQRLASEPPVIFTTSSTTDA